MKKKSKNRRQRAREHALFLLEKKGCRLPGSAPWEDIARGLVRFGLASPGQTRGAWLRPPKPSGAGPKPRPAADRPSIDYAARDANLRALGFSSYQAYLASEMWAEIRGKVLERDGEKCRLCGKPAGQVHHTSYAREVLAGRDLHRLAAICGGCHLYIEFDRETGAKRPAAEVAERYRRARRRFKAARWHEENDPLTAEFRAIVRGS